MFARRLEQPVPSREEASHGAIGDTDLGVDVLDMVARRLSRNHQALGDFLLRHSAGEVSQYLNFARGESGRPLSIPSDPVTSCAEHTVDGGTVKPARVDLLPQT